MAQDPSKKIESPTSPIFDKKKWDFYILKQIQLGIPVSKIDIPKSTKYRYLSRLKKQGLVRSPGRGVWELTKQSPKFIRVSEADIQPMQQIFHVHAYQVQFPIIKNIKKIPENWRPRKTLEKFNWSSIATQLFTEIGVIDIEKTSRSFIVTLPRLFVKEHDVATRLKNKLCFEVLDYLKAEFKGIKLEAYNERTNDFFVISTRISRHIGMPNDPLAQLCLKLGIKELKSDRLVIDNSPKNLKRLKHIYDKDIHGELEGIDKEFSQEDMLKIFGEYHHIIEGDSGKGRIDLIEKYVLANAQHLSYYGENWKAHVDFIKQGNIIFKELGKKLHLVEKAKEGPDVLKAPSKLQYLKDNINSVKDGVRLKHITEALSDDERSELIGYLNKKLFGG